MEFQGFIEYFMHQYLSYKRKLAFLVFQPHYTMSTGRKLEYNIIIFIMGFFNQSQIPSCVCIIISLAFIKSIFRCNVLFSHRLFI